MKMGEGELPASEPWYATLPETLPDILKPLLAYQQSRDLTELNIELVKQGKAPVSAATMAPQVNVGVAPELQNFMMIALAALVGGAVLYSLVGKKR